MHVQHPVYILFATVVEQDILFVLYTVPSLSICRGTQRLEGIERLGLPHNAFAQLAVHGGSVPENKTMNHRTGLLGMWEDGDEGPEEATPDGRDGRLSASHAPAWAGPPAKRSRSSSGAAAAQLQWGHDTSSPGGDGSDDETATEDDQHSGSGGGTNAANPTAVPMRRRGPPPAAVVPPLLPWGRRGLRSLPVWATNRLREVAERTIGATPRLVARGGDAGGMARSPSASLGATVGGGATVSMPRTPVPPLGLTAVVASQQRELWERDASGAAAAAGGVISGTGCTVVQGPGRTVVAGHGCTVVAGEGCTVVASAGSTAVICAGCNVSGYAEGKTSRRGHVDANMVNCLHALNGVGMSSVLATAGLQTPPHVRGNQGPGNPPSTGGGSVSTSVPVPSVEAQRSVWGGGSPQGVSTRSRRSRRTNRAAVDAEDSDHEMEVAAGARTMWFSGAVLSCSMKVQVLQNRKRAG
jgi:hypothetical protein